MANTIVVTGSSSGIGEACAIHFDRAGWRVIAGVRREQDAARLRQQGSDRLMPMLLDVTNPGQIAAVAAETARLTGGDGLQGLVNNAGIARGGPLEFIDPAEFRHQFDVNVFGLLDVTRRFLPLLHQGRGRIVNIGSIAGRVTTPLLGPYCASKHAVEGLSDALRMELLPHGISVSLVEPGVVATPIWEKAGGGRSLFDRLPAEARSRYGDMVAALGRLIERAPGRAIPVDVVVRAVDHALTARRPRTRYLLGRDARLRLVLQTLLPRRWMDALILRFFRRFVPRPA